MPKHQDTGTDLLYHYADRWRQCLIEQSSILWDGESIWNTENLESFRTCFIDNPDVSSDSFMIKFRKQLSTESVRVTKLACELLFVYYIFPSNISGKSKVQAISDVASWKNLSLNINHPAMQALLKSRGIGGAGTAYNTCRPFELAYLAECVLDLLHRPKGEREQLLNHRDEFQQILDHRQGRSNFQTRHMLLHLLFPNNYERICSTGAKLNIYKAFSEHLKIELPSDIDMGLSVIREKLEIYYPDESIDFYRNPVKDVWNKDEIKITDTKLDQVKAWIRNIKTSVSPDGLFYYKAMVLRALLGVLEREPEHDSLFTYEELYQEFTNLVQDLGGVVKEVQFAQPYARLKNDSTPLAVWIPAIGVEANFPDQKTEVPSYVKENLPCIQIEDSVWPVFQSKKSRDSILQEIDAKWPFGKQQGTAPLPSTTSSTACPNTILYGPPGTGKTYSVVDLTLEIIDPVQHADVIRNPEKRDEAVKRFKELQERRQVAFCTFHQSFGYEEFVEGLRSDGDKGFVPKDGIFKIMCEAARASQTERISGYNFDAEAINFFKMSLGNTQDASEDNIYEYCLQNGVVALGWGQELDYSDCPDRVSVQKKYKAAYGDQFPFNVDAIDRFKNWIKRGDIILVSHGNYNVKAIARVTGDYFYKENSGISFNHFRKVEWLYVSKDAMIPVHQIMLNKVLSQQTIYMFLKNDMNLENLRNYVSEKPSKEQNFVLIIDEINRGNISKIFGELITLIEPDKRLGALNETTVLLPYTGQPFGVPQNLFIIGTMNTADRSIALLDTALRRRFHFQELMPDYDTLPTDVEGIDVRKLLKVMNDRIEYLYDRDHTIGHAYFIGQYSVEGLIDVMKNKVIPLLQEYFYEDWEKVELVLGGAGSNDESYFLSKSKLSAAGLFFRQSDYDQPDKIRYQLVEHPTAVALRRIYESV